MSLVIQSHHQQQLQVRVSRCYDYDTRQIGSTVRGKQTSCIHGDYGGNDPCFDNNLSLYKEDDKQTLPVTLFFLR
jgi:hypothetical protein